MSSSRESAAWDTIELPQLRKNQWLLPQRAVEWHHRFNQTSNNGLGGGLLQTA